MKPKVISQCIYICALINKISYSDCGADIDIMMELFNAFLIYAILNFQIKQLRRLYCIVEKQ
jgi:hypothetical protein